MMLPLYLASHLIKLPVLKNCHNVIHRASSSLPKPPVTAVVVAPLKKPKSQQTEITPSGPINAQVVWRDERVVEWHDSHFEILPEPVIIQEPVKQEWISKIPVEYHGVLPDNFNNDTEWLPIYRFPYIGRVRAVIRFKIYLTAVSVSLGLLNYGMWFLGLSNCTSGFQLLLLSASTIGGLALIGHHSRQLICQVYASEDSQFVRICRFTFSGRRRDIVLPAERLIPLPELNASYWRPIFKVQFRPPEEVDLEHDEIEFYETMLKLPARYGGILDRQRFANVFGNVFLRHAE